jgi:hypothetical protein
LTGMIAKVVEDYPSSSLWKIPAVGSSKTQ